MKKIVSICILVFAFVALTAQNLVTRNQPWLNDATLLAASTSQNIRAGTTGIRYVVTSIYCTVLVSAASTVNVEASDASNVYIVIPAAAPVSSEYWIRLDAGGYITQTNGLRMTTPMAGPSVHCIAEGFRRGV